MKFYSTGCPLLDWTVGGGLPEGQMVEFLGDPDGGKTALAASIGAYFQARYGASVHYYDSEGHTPPEFLELQGMKRGEKLQHTAFPSVEEMQKDLLKTWESDPTGIHLQIVDSLAGVFSDRGDPHKMDVALRARLWRHFFTTKGRKTLAQTRHVFLVVNHATSSLDPFARAGWSSPGGSVFKFLAFSRNLVHFQQKFPRTGEMQGFFLGIRNIKAKALPPLEPYRYCSLFFRREGGLQAYYSCLLYLKKAQKSDLVGLNGERHTPQKWLSLLDNPLRKTIREAAFSVWKGEA